MSESSPHSAPLLLPQTAEYALRAMATLAHSPPGEWVAHEEIVARAMLPTAYASKVLRRLVVAGLIEGKRGWHGGFRLALRPDQITFFAVLVAVDCAPELGRCAFGYGACDGENPCPLHDAWSEVQERVREWALRTTLADTTAPPRDR